MRECSSQHGFSEARTARWPWIRRRVAGGVHAAEHGSALCSSLVVSFLSAARYPSISYLFDSLSGLLNSSQGCCFDDVYSWELQVANYKFLYPLFLFPCTNHFSISFTSAYVCIPTIEGHFLHQSKENCTAHFHRPAGRSCSSSCGLSCF